MTSFAGSMVDTPRLRQHVWTGGPEDGRPLLLVHGNVRADGWPMGGGVLPRYPGNGGRWREVVLEGVGHVIPLEVPDVVAAEIERTMADA